MFSSTRVKSVWQISDLQKKPTKPRPVLVPHTTWHLRSCLITQTGTSSTARLIFSPLELSTTKCCMANSCSVERVLRPSEGPSNKCLLRDRSTNRLSQGSARNRKTCWSECSSSKPLRESPGRGSSTIQFSQNRINRTSLDTTLMNHHIQTAPQVSSWLEGCQKLLLQAQLEQSPRCTWRFLLHS